MKVTGRNLTLSHFLRIIQSILGTTFPFPDTRISDKSLNKIPKIWISGGRIPAGLGM